MPEAKRSPAAGKTRLKASRILLDILQDRGSLANLARHTADEDQALLQELCYGVCRHFHELEAVAAGFLKKPLKNKDQDIYCLILLGLYQLFYMRIPDHAAINETVACVRKPWARGLVNAVLRGARRGFPEYSPELHSSEALRYSHPGWLVEALQRDWPTCYLEILEANNSRAPMTLRVNTRRVSRDNYLQQLRLADIDAEPGALASTSILLDQPLVVTSLPGFAEGLVSVQDEASQLVAPLLDLQPRMQVLDACAAPGGKTCAMLELEPTLEVLALDNDALRLERVTENLQRLSLQARLQCLDASQVQSPPGGFDRILLDAPCSAVGVIRRHPDIKLLRSPAQLRALQDRQQALLDALWPHLKPGGKLLYSTCSILLSENTRQIETFMNKTPDAQHLPLPVPWGQVLTFGRQLLPGEHNQDGFYYAMLQKC